MKTLENLWDKFPPINLLNVNAVYALFTFKFKEPEFTDEDRQEDRQLQSQD